MRLMHIFLQECVHTKLSTEEKFLESFRQSYGYVKLLRELDLLKPIEDDQSTSETGALSQGTNSNLKFHLSRKKYFSE